MVGDVLELKLSEGTGLSFSLILYAAVIICVFINFSTGLFS